MLVSSLIARAVSGSVQPLSFGQGKTVVLYFFRPKCHWCATNIENIRSLSVQRSSDIRFIGIATTGEGLSASLEKLPLPFPVFVIDDPSELRQVDLLGTPQTVEISPSGKVVNNWVGAFQPSTSAAIEKRFAIRLPGLVPGVGE
jgi:peroxiredoxin